MHKDDNGRLCWDADEGMLKQRFEDAQKSAHGVDIFIAGLFRQLAAASDESRQAWKDVKRRAEKQGLIDPRDELRHHWADENFEVFDPHHVSRQKPREMSAEDPGA